MSTQVIVGRSTTFSNGNPAPILASEALGSSQSLASPMPAAGSFANLAIKLTVAPGGVTSRTFTLFKNGSSTAVTLTITGAATTGSDITNSASYSAGDTLELRTSVSGSPAGSAWYFSVSFTPTTPDVSVYGWSASNLIANAFVQPFNGSGFVGTTQFAGTTVVSAPGSITDMRWRLGTAPGGVTSRTATLFKNNVAQDGTGGTPDTRVTITGASTTGNASFSLTVAAGDQITCKHTVSGSPAGATWNTGTIAFLATFPNDYQFCHEITGSNTSTKFNAPVGQAIAESATETDQDRIGGITSISIGGMYVVASGAPSAGKSWTYTLRVNGSDTGLSVTIADAATTGNASASPITITSTDTWCIKVTNVGAPGAPSADRQISLLNGTVGGPAGQPTMRRWGGSIWPMGGRRIGRGW